jgi:hypothetical protein
MIISTDQLTYSKESKRFSCEASNLNGNCGSLFHRIYPDACDAGLTIISARTGIPVDYYVDEYKLDSDGEIWGWDLKPTPESIRKVPSASGTSLLIFND